MFLGKNIRSFRKQNGLSRDKLAEVLKVNPRMITDYEIGKSEPRIAKLIILADTLGVSIDDLIRKDLFNDEGK